MIALVTRCVGHEEWDLPYTVRDIESDSPERGESGNL
jgi:hypothetical protein